MSEIVEIIGNARQILSDALPLLDGKHFRLRRAEFCAKSLLETGLISKVLLFGSLSRVGIGNDIDLIAVVDQEIVDQFLIELAQRNACEYHHNLNKKEVRTFLAIELLQKKAGQTGIRNKYFLVEHGLPSSWVLAISQIYPGFFKQTAKKRTKLDLFLLPAGWPSNKALCALFDPDEEDFLPTIAADAKTFDPVAGKFQGLPW